MGGLNFHPQWYLQNGTYLKTNAGITVSLTVTTKYYAQYTLCGVQRTDTIKVTVLNSNDVGLEKLKMLNEELRVFPVPATEEVSSIVENEKLCRDFNRITILNSMGQIIREEEIVFKRSKATIPVNELQDGL